MSGSGTTGLQVCCNNNAIQYASKTGPQVCCNNEAPRCISLGGNSYVHGIFDENIAAMVSLMKLLLQWTSNREYIAIGRFILSFQLIALALSFWLYTIYLAFYALQLLNQLLSLRLSLWLYSIRFVLQLTLPATTRCTTKE